MLYEIMKHIKNFFVTDNSVSDEFKIEDGTISLLFLKEGQYFLIEGSVFNDGVYLYPATGLTDEVFKGTITALAIPKTFLSLAEEITDFAANNKTTDNLQSESFGGYSYSRMQNGRGGVAGWQDVFKTRLNAWRKI